MAEDPAALRREAQAALDQGRLRRATRLLERLAELEPDRLRHRLDLGRVLMRREKPRSAMPHLEAACERVPEGREGAVYHQAHGDCLQALAQQELAKEKREAAQEHFEAALAAYDEAQERDPDNAVLWNNRGFSNFSLGRFNEAIRCYDESIRLAPSYAVAWYTRGYTLQIAGQLNQARRFYERSVELNPQDAIAWNNLGNVYYNQGHYERAIDIFKRSLEVEPNYIIAINNIGNALDHLGRYHESIGYHQQALDLDPTFHYAWMAKGRALTRLGQPEEGLELIETAIELEGEDADYHVALGDTLRALGRPQAAKAAYNEALKLNEADGHAWEGLAELAEAQDELLKALRFHDMAVRAFDRDARRRDLDQDWVLKAGALEKVGFSAEALNQYHNALVMVPLSARANLNRGRLLESMDRWVEALEAYEAAHQAQVQLSHNDTAREHGLRTQQSLLGQSRCLHRLGRNDEALARLERLFSELKLAGKEVHRDSMLAGSDLGITEPEGAGEGDTTDDENIKDEGSSGKVSKTPLELPTLELSRLQMEAEGRTLRGELLAGTGDLLEAADSYQEAARLFAQVYERELELLPTRVPVRRPQAKAHTEAALALKELGRHKEALEQAEAALELVSDELLPWLVAGELHLELSGMDAAAVKSTTAGVLPRSTLVHDHLAQAAAAFDGALGVDPEDETALVGRARTHLMQGHRRRALELARIATERAPELPAAWRVRADAAKVNGKEQERRAAQRELAGLGSRFDEGVPGRPSRSSAPTGSTPAEPERELVAQAVSEAEPGPGSTAERRPAARYGPETPAHEPGGQSGESVIEVDEDDEEDALVDVG